MRFFYDLPVYRLSRDAYYAAREAYVDKAVFQVGTPMEEFLRQREKDKPRVNDAFKDHLEKYFGGCWEFNEIIGYIRLHFLGTQVRGEYFGVRKSRVVKTRTKTFEYLGWKLAAEVEIESPYGDFEVLSAVREYIADCKAELPRRHIDTSRFDEMAPFVKWAELFRQSESE